MFRLDRTTKIALFALIALALSVFFITYVPAVHHPTEVDGVVSDNFPSWFESLAYVASIFAILPASAVTLIVVFAVKVKHRFTSKGKAER